MDPEKMIIVIKAEVSKVLLIHWGNKKGSERSLFL